MNTMKKLTLLQMVHVNKSVADRLLDKEEQHNFPSRAEYMRSHMLTGADYSFNFTEFNQATKLELGHFLVPSKMDYILAGKKTEKIE